ncbi:MAG: CHAP domain-containing protein [Gammaproteobacteria bacterium]|nr:CHAP domain-containing protein [Gammaproteobacteria bacterium]
MKIWNSAMSIAGAKSLATVLTAVVISISSLYGTTAFAVSQCGGQSSTGNPFPCNRGNCTWWAAKKASEAWFKGDWSKLPSTTDAKLWDDHARSNENYSVSTSPKASVIAVKNRSPYCSKKNNRGHCTEWQDYGHVAWVERVSGSNVIVSEMYWGVYGKKTKTYKSNYFDAYISYGGSGGEAAKLVLSTVTVNPNPMVQGSPVTVKAKVRNTGNATFRGDIASALHNLNGSRRGDIQRFNGISIRSGKTKSFTFKKSTITSGPGNYLMRVNFQASDGEWDVLHQQNISVKSGTRLEAVDLIAPATLKENKCANLTVKGRFSDGSTKKLSPYRWREYGSSTNISTKGRLCASRVTRNEKVKVKAYVNYNGQRFYPNKYVTVKDMNSPPARKRPSRIYIYGCSSINERRNCSYRAKVRYTDNTTKTVTPRWSEDSAKAYFRGSRLYTRSVRRNEYVNVRASYTENGKTVTSSKRVKIRNR